MPLRSSKKPKFFNLSQIKLTGDKINLGLRPASKLSTASSRNSLLLKCASRPMSAVPRLMTTEESHNEPTTSANNRPFSAGCIPGFYSPNDESTSESLGTESVEHLPSSSLLKNLLEEPIKSWRNLTEYEPKIDKKVTENENIQSDLNTSSNSDESVVKAISESNKILEGTKCLLTPGLTAKPPIPKKSSATSKSPNCYSPSGPNDPEIENSRCYEENIVGVSEEELDSAMQSYLSLTYENEIGKDSAKYTQKNNCDRDNLNVNRIKSQFGRFLEIPEQEKDAIHNSARNEKVYFKETNLLLSNKEDNFNCKPQTFTQPNENNKIIEETQPNSQYDNWMSENMKDIFEKETVTDTYIQQVKTHCDNTRTSKCLDYDEYPNLSDINVDELFSEGNIVKKHSISPADIPCTQFTTQSDVSTKKKQIKSPKIDGEKSQNSKERSKSAQKRCPKLSPKNNTNINDKEKRNKFVAKRGKFVATPMKCMEDAKGPGEKPIDDVESWLGKKSQTKNEILSGQLSVVLNLLGNIENTESPKSQNFDCVPERENPKIVTNNELQMTDEIDSILEVLDIQDKTSQHSINAMKKIVTSELSNSRLVNEDENNLLFRRLPEIRVTKEVRELTVDSFGSGKRELLKSDETRQSHFLQVTSQKSSRGSTASSFNDDHEHISECHNHNRQKFEGTKVSNYSRPDISLSNYRELLGYLDEVDKNCTKSLELARERALHANRLVESSMTLDTMPKFEDLLTHTNEELASYVINLSLRIKEKSSSISLLQSELSQLREQVLSQNKKFEQTLKQKLKEQKDEAETVTKRHQKFIDQLISDKKHLNKRCEDLVDEMKKLEERYSSNMKAIEFKHEVELRRLKDMQTASEKYRRERWIDTKTQKIKEMTVKSIEPELQSMEKRQQQELSDVRAMHKREIEELEIRSAKKLQEQSETIREQLIQDREKALAHERDIMRVRYEKMVETEEKSYQEQRRRLLADHSNRITECEEREAASVAEKERGIKQAHEEFEERLQATMRRHSNEIKLIKETAVLEMENWKNSFKKTQAAQLVEKETAIRKQCRKERDKEIEAVIERLESEANKAKLQIEQTTENRIRRLKEKYEAEIKDLELLEKEAQTKYCDARSKLMEYEEVILTLRNNTKQIESQLEDAKSACSKLENEREKIREVIRNEFKDKLEGLENEVATLKSSADKQVEQLYSRVRVSLARKDEILNELTSDHKALQEKCLYLESVMEQQRKDLLTH